jgi:hypothetical protein
MYNAPAVRFPVARSQLAASGLVLIWAVGALAGVGLAVTASQPAWLLPAVVALCLAVGFAALSHWRSSPVGTLLWDRKQWAFAPSQLGANASMTLDDVSVHLDFQSMMLVSFRPPTGRRLWFWLENRKIEHESGREAGRKSGRSWRALRRAVFAHPKDKVASSGQSPKRAESLPA